jgi:hypothetical protein
VLFENHFMVMVFKSPQMLLWKHIFPSTTQGHVLLTTSLTLTRDLYFCRTFLRNKRTSVMRVVPPLLDQNRLNAPFTVQQLRESVVLEGLNRLYAFVSKRSWALSIVAATIFCPCAIAQAQLSFDSEQYVTAAGPSAVATADIDGDGDLDLVVSCGGFISVLKNSGDGRFLRTGNFNSLSSSIALGDLNGNGKPDIAGASSALNSVEIFPNRLKGRFPRSRTFGTGVNPVSIQLEDLDGDGDLDIAVANVDSQSVSILKNNGRGVFSTPQNIALDGIPSSLVIKDFDGDGDLDIAVLNIPLVTPGTNFDPFISVLKNQGNASFVAGLPISLGSIFLNAGQVALLVAGDFDADGDTDLAVRGNQQDPLTGFFVGTLFVLSNTGTGDFTIAPQQLPQSLSGASSSGVIATGDFDRDGDLDLALGGSTGLVSLVLNNGSAVFADGGEFGTGSSPSSIIVADFDGDDRLDLAATTTSASTVTVLLNRTPAPQTTLNAASRSKFDDPK